MAVNKAAGYDGWGVELLRHRLLMFYGNVEDTGEWPLQLARTVVVMLPKPGGEGPLGFRPVCLLSQIYRVWAKVRLPEVRRWLQINQVRTSAVELKGAEELALHLAMLQAEGRLYGEELVVLATDFAKAYDTISLGAIKEVMVAAAMPKWIAGPVLAAYHQERIVRCGMAVGQWHKPVRGLVPGCPLATYLMALLVFPWQKLAEQGGSSTRTWVDDCVAWSQGPTAQEDVAAAVRAMKVQVAAGDFVVAPHKSALVATAGALEDQLQQQVAGLGIERKAGTKDLGVPLGTVLKCRRWCVTGGRSF